MARQEPYANLARERTGQGRSTAITRWFLLAFAALAVAPVAASEPSSEIPGRWLAPQAWRRDSDRPALALGEPNAFDDTHIFAPCVARRGESFWMWYSGSRGEVGRRVFRLGLAVSDDGVRFRRHPHSPVLAFDDGKRSVLTPTLLRRLDGTPIRENGRLRLWFSSTHFAGGAKRHTLHETTSEDGIRWTRPSPPLLEHAYAPSILTINGTYHMWYTDVRAEPWRFRYADSKDGRRWTVREQPVLEIDQPWERGRLFYPTVVRADGLYCMWYGSYWSAHKHKTALGFAASRDGIRWHKSPLNPVLRPEPRHAWESHYTTSQSVVRLPDGSWRIWYATRKAPPFTNKYFAIGTARWSGPKE